MQMNKTIYMLWFEGFDVAPMIVRECLNSWKRHNSSWSVVTLDRSNLHNYVNLSSYVNVEMKDIGPAHESDLVRLMLLQKYGGVWADATTYCMKPLDDWLHEYIHEGFFVFDQPGPDRPISNWFIYAESGNLILNQLYKAMGSYWEERSTTDDYFCFHHTFGRIYEENVEFKNSWDRTIKFSADVPHFIQKAGLLAEPSADVKNHIDKAIAPLYKLTYRYRESLYNNDSTLAYLLKSHNLSAKKLNRESKKCALIKMDSNTCQEEMLTEAFETVYRNNRWGDVGNHSGLGSTIDSARNIMSFIDKLITELNVRKIVDVSCGGMLWLSKVLSEHPEVEFIGLDASKTAIDRNRQQFKDNPNWIFRVHDYTSEDIVECDLIICRHTIMHLKQGPGLKMVNNLFKSARYILLTSHENVAANPKDEIRKPLVPGVEGGYCWINMDMKKSPFLLPEPVLKQIESSNNSGEFLYLYVNRGLNSSLQMSCPSILTNWEKYIHDKLVPLIGPSPEGNIYSKHLSHEPCDLLVAKQRNILSFLLKFRPRTMLEIGFNTGYSALLMKMFCPKLQLTCVDVNFHDYVLPCYRKIHEDFKSIDLHLESSHTMLPKLIAKNHTYDAIHIDGDHSPHGARQDFQDCLALARPGTVILFDDTNQKYLNDICQSFVDAGRVKEYLFDKVEGIRYNHRFLQVI